MAHAAFLRAQNRANSKGTDPRIATCRGKLQSKRSKLNQEINKELRLRAGAENLFKATTNRKLRETVALELSFVNSNLQLLKEQLAELNSSVELYQGESSEPVMPMIPLGLKETKEIDFKEPFKDFILEHYSEDGDDYDAAISAFMDLRQSMRAPPRDSHGISLLLQYYNQLYFIERRFFPPDRSLGIYFEWYDSLTGVPSCQRTVAFERACVLFNMSSIYTQMGAKQDRLSGKGLDQAIDSFLRAAGTFTYIQENFMNAPSMDLAPHMIDMLIQLMLAQARECLFEKLELQSKNKRDVDICIDLAQEAAQVSDTYLKVINLILVPAVRDYVPYSWIALLQVKREHYTAISHYYAAICLLSSSSSKSLQPAVIKLHQTKRNCTSNSIGRQCHSLSVTVEQRKQLGRAHLRLALLFHEEAQRIYRMCRELRNKHFVANVLAKSKEKTAHAYDRNANEQDDFAEIFDPPLEIRPSSNFELSLTRPDFSHLPVEDLFHSLGPVAVFSAKHHWTAPRIVHLHRSDNPSWTADIGFGFSIRGDTPIIVAAVDPVSLAHFAGMKEGDFIVSINDQDIKWCQHDEAIRLIKHCEDYLTLKLVTPMDRNYYAIAKNKTGNSNDSKEAPRVNKDQKSEHSPSSSVSTHKKLTWNPFRKQRV